MNKVEINGIYYNLDECKKTAQVTDSPPYKKYRSWVSIPETVTYNGITYSVTSIGEGAFDGCSGLTSVNIPGSVTNIGDWAFGFCSGLTSVNIPNSVTSIGDYAFAGCTELKSINIPDSVTSIGDDAFAKCESLEYVDLPDSVTSIGNWAFMYCSGLTSVNIPNSVKKIGDCAFSNCTGLTSVKVEAGNTTYDSRNNCNAIIETATNTLIAGCKNTTIPNSVKKIGHCAFFGRSGLTSVNISNSVTSIGKGAFNECSGLDSIKVEVGNTIYDSRNDCNAIIETATNTLIAGCKNTTIPNSVTSIGDNAFWGCKGLTSVDIPSSVTSIGNSAFSGCSGLTSVNIPNSVTNIGYGAFSGCSGLTSVNIPDSVKSIEDKAFNGCSGLDSINVETGNRIYDSRNNCNAIIETATNTLITGCKNSTIPNSVTRIGEFAFSRCSGLTSVNIPNSVTSIGKYAFTACKRLADVYCYAENMPSTERIVFDYSYIRKATLHVPAASIEQYKTTEPWSDFGTIVAIDEAETQASRPASKAWAAIIKAGMKAWAAVIKAGTKAIKVLIK